MQRDSEMFIDERGTMKVRLEQSRFGIGGARLRVLVTATVVASTTALLFCASSSAAVTHVLQGTFEGPEILTIADAADNSAGPSAGDLYVAGFGSVEKFNADGTAAGVLFTGEETPQASFSMLSENIFTGALAVDSSSGPNSGDVYVSDMAHDLVDKFSETGKFICQITGQATPSSAECAGATGSETHDGSIEPTGIAVDTTSGNVWVSDRAHAAIDEFNAAGEYVGQIKDSHVVAPGPVALDSGGNLYVTNIAPLLEPATSNSVVVLHGGGFVRVLDGHEPLSVAVDPSSDHVYVFEHEGNQVAEYESDGTLIDKFGEKIGEAGVPYMLGLAVSGDGRVYGTETFSNLIAIYSPDIVTPDVATGSAIGVSETTATLQGHVDPDAAQGGGAVTSCEFEYVTEEAFRASGFKGASEAACVPAVPFSTPQDVSATVTLAPSTKYEFRLRASNANEVASFGETSRFATVGAPVITGEKASTLAANVANLSATIAPSGFEADCHVEYLDEATYQRSGFADATTQPCAQATILAASSEEAVSAKVGGLALNTTYHYRFVSSNPAGTAHGADQTFATFGIKSFSFEVLDKEGHPYTQAGGHPYEWTTSFALNSTPAFIGKTEVQAADANVRDVEAELPSGLIASSTATARCPRALVALDQCSPATQVGELEVETAAKEGFIVGLYNVLPPSGVPVEFGAVVENLVRVYIDGNVRTGGDYGATARVLSTSADDNVTSTRVTIWGVPADPSHDSRRACPIPGEPVPIGGGTCPPGGPLVPLLTNPTSCSGTPLAATLRADSWQAPNQFVSATTQLPAITGCDALDFTPAMTITPDTSVADSPAGLDVNLEVPQNETPSGLVSSDLKDTTVHLPAGVAVSASAANGLEACSEAEIGLGNGEPPRCPNGSKIGTVEVTTPLLPDHLTGGVYVARQGENPFHSLLAMYVAAEADGARVKLAGHVVPDPVTGQLTTTFEETPQLPFSDFKFRLFGGRRGALATPESCGTFTSTVSLAPWDGLAAMSLAPSFSIDSGCVSGFRPTLSAGTASTQAGSYSPFALSLARTDTDEEVSGLTVKLPPGLLAKIAGVPLCTDAQAAADACPAASEIGTVVATAGPGLAPLSLPGRMYLTGPYKGAPYGEETVVPAVAGPFNLGDVVVRGTIRIDPVTAQATVTSDPFPTIVQGIPTRLRRVDVTVDRPGFVFNPTSCDPLTLSATAGSTGGAVAGLQSRFQVGGCGELPFKPSFKATVGGPGSRLNGVSFDVKISAPHHGPQAGGARSEANIRKVEVQLPEAIPSRLLTLQKACTEAQFATNPAGCPPASIVGRAVAHTPALPDTLEGPAYLVSHGGAQFPDLVLDLSGNGVAVVVTGHTQIKHGITFSRFETVPDAPVSSFELNLPSGPKSLLGVFGNICNPTVAKKLVMPTTITAQSGAVLKQSTKLPVSGCKRHKTRKRGKRH
jgi:sugar lactone lactonase YvrE